MARATNEEWTRYYATARQRRRIVGGDPWDKYRTRKEAQERRIFVGSSLSLAVLLVIFYVALVR